MSLWKEMLYKRFDWINTAERQKKKVVTWWITVWKGISVQRCVSI